MTPPANSLGSLTVAVDADLTLFKEQMADAAKLGTKLGASLATAFEGIAFKGKSLTSVLASLTQSISHMVLASAFKPLGQGLVGGFSNLFAGDPFGGGLGDQLAGFGGGALPVPFAKGGVISQPTTFPLGSGTGLAGERGPEAIMPLARGPDGRLGVAGAGSAGPAITFHVSTPDLESFRRSETQIAALLSRALAQGDRNL